MLCYAIVVTYNGSKWVDKCFGGLLNSTFPVKIIAVDNCSSDDTLDLLRGKFPSVEIVGLNKNLGFGGANNVGIAIAQKAGADYIFLLNQDAWVDPDTIENLIRVDKMFSGFGIISPVHLNGDGNAFDYGFMNCLCGSKEKIHLSDFYLKPKAELNNIYRIDFVNAAAWLLSRKTIEKVGGFNPLFFQYGEDQDYVNRCKYFRLKIGFVPLAKVYHGRPQYDTDEKKQIVLRTTILAGLLDPEGENKFNKNIRDLVVSIIKDLLFFRLRQVKFLFGELRFYFLNKKNIFDNISRAKKEGMTFLG